MRPSEYLELTGTPALQLDMAAAVVLGRFLKEEEENNRNDGVIRSSALVPDTV